MRDGWVETTFGEIARLEKGISYKSTELCQEGIGLPFINLKSIDRGGGYRSDGLKWYSGKYKESQIVSVGDLILCCTDLTKQKAILGYPILTPNIGFEKFAISLDLAKVVVNGEKVLNKYLFMLLQDKEMRSFMQSRSSGTTVMHLKTSEVPSAKILLPNLYIQKRIVDLISSVDSYIKALQYQVDKARKSRNAVLHELLTNGGDDWVVTKLGLISDFVMGQAPLGERCNKEGIGTPFVKAGEFQENRPKIVEWTTDPLKFAKSTDVLVCVVGATAGKINLGADCAIGRSVAAVRPQEVLNQFYLYYLLSLELSNLRSGSRGSAQGVITRDDLYRIAVSLPPLAEQKRIVEIISVFDNQIEALDSIITKTHNLRSALLSDLLSGNHEIPTRYDKIIGAA